jgi:hypothetical protein
MCQRELDACGTVADLDHLKLILCQGPDQRTCIYVLIEVAKEENLVSRGFPTSERTEEIRHEHSSGISHFTAGRKITSMFIPDSFSPRQFLCLGAQLVCHDYLCSLPSPLHFNPHPST